MVRSVAVVAHFDVNNVLEENFRQVISCLSQTFDAVILVSTSDLMPAETSSLGKNVTIILRPNFGYDFYSYRVGVQHALQYAELEHLVLVNSSFVISSSAIFSRTLQALLSQASQYDVVGITESRQFHWHLQSYLLLLSRRMFRAPGFAAFLEGIRPLNSKFEVILAYELGLSRLIDEMQLKACALFQPDRQTRLTAYCNWMRVLLRDASISDLVRLKPLRHLREVNWTHFGATQIAQEFGLIKAEVLRNNPHRIQAKSILDSCTTESRSSIQLLLEHSKKHYSTDSSGLSTLQSAAPGVPVIRTLSYGRPGARGVRIAVVLHLYYVDLIGEICSYLKNIVEPFDLYITTPFEGDIKEILDRFSLLAHSVTVCVTENRGRDIGPFVALYRSGRLDGYLAVLKLHSKKSKYSDLGSTWRNRLYNSLAGDSLTVRRTIHLFEDSCIGIIGPHYYYLSHDSFWGANQIMVERLLRAVGALEEESRAQLGFFAGSMFWFSPAVLKPIKCLNDDELLFEPESGMQDGTLAHAIERIFCELARNRGYITSSLELAGREINETETSKNRVPVL
ncbi:hypothetical protein RN02_24525 [Pseudomonas sp. PI1]|jgi:rhamnosyltransferase|nr:hypothetical protein RN02_24525 [Pseudomonas sp. PI1]